MVEKKYSTEEEFKSFIHNVKNPKHLVSWYIFAIGLAFAAFLQPTLQKRWSPFTSTIIVGIIWAVWHLPLWFVNGSNQMNMNFLWFSLTALALSFLITIIYLSTKSIFRCIIFHALINSFWNVYIPVTNVTSGLFTFLFALFLFIVYQKSKIRIFSDGQ